MVTSLVSGYTLRVLWGKSAYSTPQVVVVNIPKVCMVLQGVFMYTLAHESPKHRVLINTLFLTVYAADAGRPAKDLPLHTVYRGSN